MMRRSTSFLSKTLEAGPSSDIALPPKKKIIILHKSSIFTHILTLGAISLVKNLCQELF